jgi:hypothetical protein
MHGNDGCGILVFLVNLRIDESSAAATARVPSEPLGNTDGALSRWARSSPAQRPTMPLFARLTGGRLAPGGRYCEDFSR